MAFLLAMALIVGGSVISVLAEGVADAAAPAAQSEESAPLPAPEAKEENRSFFGTVGETLKNLAGESGAAMFARSPKTLIMVVVACVLLYLAIVKKFEPLLLLPIAFGMLLTNLLGSEVYHEELFAGGHANWSLFGGAILTNTANLIGEYTVSAAGYVLDAAGTIIGQVVVALTEPCVIGEAGGHDSA